MCVLKEFGFLSGRKWKLPLYCVFNQCIAAAAARQRPTAEKQYTNSWSVTMEPTEWVARCSARLHAQWPRLHRQQRDEVARDLWNDQRWQHREPEVAVVEWLCQGIPVPAGSGAP